MIENFGKLISNGRVLLFASLLALIPAAAGVTLAPRLFETSRSNPTSSEYMQIAAIMLIIVIVLLGLLAMLFSTAKQVLDGKQVRSKHYIKPLLALAGCGIIVMIVMSVVYGFLSVFILKMFKGDLTTDQVKGVIDWVTLVLTVAQVPIFATILSVCALEPGKAIVMIKKGLAALKNTYFPMLVLLLLAFALGFILLIPMGALTGLSHNLVSILVYSFLGVVMNLMSLAVYHYYGKQVTKSQKSGKKKVA